MSDGITVNITGLKELEENLRQLSEDVRNDMLTAATRAGAEVIRAEAMRLAPKERGVSSPKSIVSRIKIRMKQPDAFGVRAYVVAGAPHSHLLEFGTKAHKILAGAIKSAWGSFGTSSSGKKMLADKAAGKFFGSVVNHPGNRAKPFLRPAYEMKKMQAVNTIADVLREKIAKYRVKHTPRVA